MQRRSLLASAAAAALAFAAGPGFAQSRELRLLTGWDDRSDVVTRVVVPLMAALEAASSGAFTLRRFGPETIPPFEQLDPVGRGVFDVLFTNGAYHYNQSAVAMAVEAFDVTPQTLRSSGLWDYVDAHYRQFGVKLIAYLVDPNGYSLILREPLGPDALAGSRIRGTTVYHPLIEALGGAPVVLPASEIYPALERGVVDGAAWPLVGPYGFRWFEVSDYMMRPAFGRVGYPVFVSLDLWNSLGEEQRNALAKAAADYELSVGATFDAMVKTEEAALLAEGMQVTEMDEARAQTLGVSWTEGVLALAGQQNQQAVSEMTGIGQKAGLLPAATQP